MTTHARAVLADCEVAFADFEASANTRFHRSRWVAMITLLRTVLDVLDKVDRRTGTPEAQERIAAARKELFESKPDPRIFHEFIEDERNDTVHVYEIRARGRTIIQLGSVWWNPGTGESGGTPSGPAKYDFYMSDGPFKGRDPRELCRDAIEFWRQYLDNIDAERVR